MSVDRSFNPVAPRAEILLELSRAASSGNRDAELELLRLLAPDILRVIRSVLGHHHPDAEDVLQDSLLGLARGLGQFRHESSVLHFALTIAFRHALAAKRRKGDVAKWIDTYQQLEEPLSTEPSSPAQTLEMELRRVLVSELLSAIPKAQAEALGLRVVAGLSIDDIARTTQVAANTVRSRLRLAKAALRKAIQSDSVLSELLGPE